MHACARVCVKEKLFPNNSRNTLINTLIQFLPREIHHFIEESKWMIFLSLNSHENVVRSIIFKKYV